MFLDFQEVRDIVVYYILVFGAYSLSSTIQDVRYPVWAGIVFLSFPLILPDDSKLRKIVCFISFLLVALLSSWFFVLLFLFKPFHPTNLRYVECMEAFLTSIFGITYEFKCLENLDKYKKAVIIMNHQSVLDTFVVLRMWKWLGSPRAIVKKEVFYFWPIGLATWLSGMIFVEKMAGPIGWNNFMNVASKHLNSDLERPSIVMFPEGKRNPNRKTLMPFKKGAFRLAASSQVPIVPIVISPYNFLSSFHLKRGKVIVTVLDPISEDNYTNTDDFDSAVQNVWEMMNQVYRTNVS